MKVKDLIPTQATDVQCIQDAAGNTPTGGGECMFRAFGIAFGGETTFTFVVGGGLLLALLMGSDYEPAPVAVGTMLLSGILVARLPPQYQSMAVTVMILGFIVGVWAVGKRYFLEVGR